MTNTRTRKVPAVSSRAATRQSDAPPVDSDPTRRPHVVEPIDDAGSLALGAVLDELGALDDASIMLYRLAGRGQELEYVATLTPEQVQGEASLLEMIRLEHGGGTYRVHVRDGAGLLANRRIVIAERKGPAAVDGGLSAVVASMMDRQAQQFGELIRTLAPRADASSTEEAMLARLKMMADIVRPAQGTDTKELLGLLMQGVTLGKSMQPPADTGAEGLMANALAAFAPVIADAAAQRRTVPVRRIGPGQPQPKAPPPAAVPMAPAPTPAAAPAAADDENAELRNLMRIVLRAAEADADEELYAELVLDQVGADQLKPLATAPEGVDLVAMLAQIEPAVLQHREWFDRLIAAIVELMNDEPDAATLAAHGHPIGPGGGATNAADHASAGA